MMSNSNYSIGLQRLKPVHTAYCERQKLVLGTRCKWPRPRRDVDNFSRDETETGRWYVSRPRRRDHLETETSRPRRRDRDHNPGKQICQTCKSYREHTVLVSLIWLHHIFTTSCRIRWDLKKQKESQLGIYNV